MTTYAFPNVHDPQTGAMAHGMTLKDYFAGQALIAYIKEDEGRFPVEQLAKAAYEMAEEMMKARDL